MNAESGLRRAAGPPAGRMIWRFEEGPWDGRYLGVHDDCLVPMVIDAGQFDYCPAVLEYDNSIGGEGEITCGARIVFGPDPEPVCEEGHRFEPCACGRSFCTGWRYVG